MLSDGSEQTTNTPERHAPQRSRDEALLEFEVSRVMHALAPYGILREDALARECGARRWRGGQFRRAVEAAIRSGRLRRLPLGFYGRATPRTSSRGGTRR